MSRYRSVELHLEQLDELRSIITSMKTLSQLELRKLGGVTASQTGMVATLETIAADFLRFFPRHGPSEDNELWLMIGSERGFCGGSNESLVTRLLGEWPGCVEQPQRVVAVGHKLCVRLDEALPGYAGLVGASSSEEIPSVLARVMTATQEQMQQQGSTSLRLLFHCDDRNNISSRRLLPPEPGPLSEERSNPPLVQPEPDVFFSDFLQHHLLLSLTRLFTVSLLAENQYRVQHLEGAVNRLDERLEALSSRARALRQEDITEEIEMILLGSGAFDTPG
jgi:F-type H+-transporting ATPase subunit gamma